MRTLPKLISWGSLAALAILSFPREALGQSNAALAEKLFAEGQKLLEAGQTHEACERLAASQRIDPALGTLINLALCHERDGKTATAWGEYVDAAGRAMKSGERDREQFAREHAATLGRIVPKLRITIAGQTAETHVTLDAMEIPASALGGDIPVDPGEHVIEARAPGKKTWTLVDLHVVAGGATTRIDGTLEDAAPEKSPSQLDGRALGTVVGGAGLVALGAGVALLLRAAAFDRKSRDEATKANLFVPPDPAFKDASLSDHSAAQTNQAIGLVAGGVGVAAIGVGLYLVVTSKSGDESHRADRVRILPSLGTTGGAARGVDLAITF